MRTNLKRMTSLFLALVMVLTMIPTAALAAGVNESLVSSLAAIYDGDEARAREELEALYEAGIIDADGSLVALDIREDGASVALDELARRIADGETVGELTVNGNPATPEQILQIRQVKSLLEVVRLLDEDVEITDEHVANLQALLEGIADGGIDLDEAILNGELSLSARSALLTAEAPEPPGLPETKTGYGTVGSNGAYTDHFIDGDTYEESHSFALADPSNNVWYSDSTTDGLGLDGVVTLSLSSSYFTQGRRVRFYATLDKAQSVPVSFDYWVTGGYSGTVTWAPGESGEVEFFMFDINVIDGDDDYWNGRRACVLTAGNIKNATFPEGKSAYNMVLPVQESYSQAALWTEVGSITRVPEGTGKNETVTYSYDPLPYNEYQDTYTVSLSENVGFIPKNSPLSVTVTLSAKPSSLKDGVRCYYEQFGYSKIIIGNKEYSGPGAGDTSKTIEIPAADLASLPSPVTLKCEMQVAYKYGMPGIYNPENYRPQYFKISSIVAAGVPQTKAIGVSVPGGTYYSGQTVPIAVMLDNYTKVTANAKLKVNEVDCPVLDGENTITK